jgi:hypothetical protein
VGRGFEIFGATALRDPEGITHSTFVYGIDRDHVIRIAQLPEMTVMDYMQCVRWLPSH